MNHPVLGELRPSPAGWLAVMVLPAFQACYERWDTDGSELPDRRDEEQRQGRFSALLLYPDGRLFGRSDKRFGPGGKADDLAPPCDPQIAAFDYLVRSQSRVAHELLTALAREAPHIFPWFAEDLPDDLKRLLGTVEGMRGAVALQSLVVSRHDSHVSGAMGEAFQARDGCAVVGLALQSDLLDTEHGVAVVMHRDRVVEIGQQDILPGL